MKCDKLKAYGMADTSIDDEYEMYKVTEVDEAIAELKEKLHDVDNQWNEQCKEIAQLKAENERLKAKLDKKDAEIESLKATHDTEMMDAGMRERRLQRALWLARALRARDIQRWWIAATCAPMTERACSVWNNVERKCLKKAEEYNV